MAATADIFISHSSADDEFGRAFAHSLRFAFQEKSYRGHEVTVWYDSTHIHSGDVWVEELSSALGSCSVFILILSPAAIQSDWVFDEYTIAKSADKKIIPIVWIECKEILKAYKNGRWTLLVNNQYATFNERDAEIVDSQRIAAKPAFQELCQKIEEYFGTDLQALTEATVQSPEDHLMQQLLEVLNKNFRHQRWKEVILLSDLMIQQMEAFIPADIYYMRGVALQKEMRYSESDVALALALALARPNVKEEKEKDKVKERKDKEKEQRINYLQARVDTLQHIGGRWKEIYHTAQDAVSLLPEDKWWSRLAHSAQLELQRNPLLNNPSSPILLRNLSMHTFGTRTLGGATRTVEDLAWSPNCEFLAAACGDSNVYVWRAKAVAERPTFIYDKHQSHVTAVDWSPDKTQIASSSRDKTVHIWRLGEEGKIVRPPWLHKDWVNDIAWSADGLQLASACQDRMVRIWDVPLQRQKEASMEHTSPVRTIAWHPDNIHLAAGCANGEVYIWNTQTNSEKRLLSADKRGCIYKLIWLSDRESLLAASADKHVHVWEQVIQGVSSYKAITHDHIVFALTHSMDEKYIASSNGDWVRVWERATNKIIFTNGVHHGRVMSIVWAPDNMHVASAGEDKLIQVWNFTRDGDT